MNKTLIAALGTLSLAACSGGAGEAPADNSPVTPEVVCEDFEVLNTTTSKCVREEAEVKDSDESDANVATGN